MLATAATLGAGCAGYSGSQAGEVSAIDPELARQTVVLEAVNTSDESVELRIVAQNQNRFVGSVQPRDTSEILLDKSLFPAGEIYVIAIGADPRNRAVSGPLSASRGDRIMFRLEPTLSMSRAHVIR